MFCYEELTFIVGCSSPYSNALHCLIVRLKILWALDSNAMQYIAVQTGKLQITYIQNNTNET